MENLGKTKENYTFLLAHALFAPPALLPLPLPFLSPMVFQSESTDVGSNRSLDLYSKKFTVSFKFLFSLCKSPSKNLKRRCDYPEEASHIHSRKKEWEGVYLPRPPLITGLSTLHVESGGT